MASLMGAKKTMEAAYGAYKMERKFRNMTKRLGPGGVKAKVSQVRRKNPQGPSHPGPRGKLAISVIEGKNLQNVDLVGKSDPYVTLEIGDQKCKTKVCSNTLNPKWNAEFSFDVSGHRFVTVRVMDRDRFTKDDVMGELVLKVKHFNEQDGVDDWFELDTQGSIRLKMMFVPSLVGQISVRALEARGLAKADVSGKADPYCVVKVGNRTEKTKTCKRTLSPKWNMQWDFNVSGDTYVSFVIMDWDRVSGDDLMGEAIFTPAQGMGGVGGVPQPTMGGMQPDMGGMGGMQPGMGGIQPGMGGMQPGMGGMQPGMGGMQPGMGGMQPGMGGMQPGMGGMQPGMGGMQPGMGGMQPGMGGMQPGMGGMQPGMGGIQPGMGGMQPGMGGMQPGMGGMGGMQPGMGGMQPGMGGGMGGYM